MLCPVAAAPARDKPRLNTSAHSWQHPATGRRYYVLSLPRPSPQRDAADPERAGPAAPGSSAAAPATANGGGGGGGFEAPPGFVLRGEAWHLSARWRCLSVPTHVCGHNCLQSRCCMSVLVCSRNSVQSCNVRMSVMVCNVLLPGSACQVVIVVHDSIVVGRCNPSYTPWFTFSSGLWCAHDQLYRC